jgi:hypothetical protein
MFVYNMKTPKKSGSLVLNCLNCGALYEYQYETDCHKKGQRMSELSRLKPDPIPTIHPVPEYAADTALTAYTNALKVVLVCHGWVSLQWPSRIIENSITVFGKRWSQSW